MNRRYVKDRAGSHPTDTTVLASCELAGSTWTLYGIDTRKGWHNIKLCADRAPRKANYRLAWHTVERRLAGGRETESLAQRPELLAWVVETMRGARWAGPLTDERSWLE